MDKGRKNAKYIANQSNRQAGSQLDGWIDKTDG